MLLLLILSVMMEGLNGDLWLFLVYVRGGEGGGVGMGRNEDLVGGGWWLDGFR